MYATPFNSETDLAPIPFDRRLCKMAAKLKEAGLLWRPHVGCFVWDRDEHIAVASPFPGRIYFILNLGRFLDIFKSIENMTEKLIWLPSWHQARLLCDRHGIDARTISDIHKRQKPASATEEAFSLYETLLEVLSNS
jgi:hypothetical protein